jgi:hypothetical protein
MIYSYKLRRVSKMKKYLTDLFTEKGYNLDHVLEVPSKGIYGTNYIPLESVIEFVCKLDKDTRVKIRKTFVMIDFKNGDIMHFVNHIAKGMAV